MAVARNQPGNRVRNPWALMALGAITQGIGCHDAPPDSPASCVSREFTVSDACEGRQFERLRPPASADTEVGHFMPEGLPFHAHNSGGGAVLEDLDGDGWLDLVVSNGISAPSLSWNQGNSWTTCTGSLGAERTLDPDGDPHPTSLGVFATGVSTADVDNDGDFDIFVARRGRDHLWVNIGDRKFEEMSDAFGLGADESASSAGYWADFNGDGRLDLFVTKLPELAPFNVAEAAPAGARLWIGSPSGFVESDDPEVTGLSQLGSALAAALVDFDSDGDIDIFLTQEFAELHGGHRLLLNAGPDAAGQPRFVRHELGDWRKSPQSPMGIALFFSAEGWPELFITNLVTTPPGREVYLQFPPSLEISDRAEALAAQTLGLSGSRTSSWGALAWDVDLDGDRDLYVALGQLRSAFDFDLAPEFFRPGRPDQPNAFLRREATGFVEVPDSCAMSRGSSRGLARGDIDRDGCEDLVVVELDRSVTLLRNRCGASQPDDIGPHRARWLGLRLWSMVGPRDATGARVTLHSDPPQHALVSGCVEAAHSCSTRELHFGLGATTADTADLSIDWPSGCTETRRALALDRRHTLTEPTACPPEPDQH